MGLVMMKVSAGVKGLVNEEGPYKVLLILGCPFVVKSSPIEPVRYI